MLVNIVPTPKITGGLLDRAREAQEKLGYGPGCASRLESRFRSTTRDIVAATSQEPDRLQAAAITAVPRRSILWYRTSPRLLMPLGDENNVSGQNPPLTVGDMTLLVVDA